MKAVVAAFNQEKALVGAFSVIKNLWMELFQALVASTSLVVYRVKGFCTGNHERWFYDPESDSCRTFNYGGCFGNSNRFLTRADCEESCGSRHEDGAEAEVCGLPRDPGPWTVTCLQPVNRYLQT